MFDPDAIERKRDATRLGGERAPRVPGAPAREPPGVPDRLVAARRAGLHARRRRRHGPRGARPAGSVSLHARAVPDHVPGTALDDAADRGLRDGKRYQQALSLPDRTRTNGTFG